MDLLNDLTITAATWAVVAGAAWLIGDRVMRLAGLGGLALGVIYLLTAAGAGVATPLSYVLSGLCMCVGLAIWVIGHRITAARQGLWSSTVAASLWRKVTDRTEAPR